MYATSSSLRSSMFVALLVLLSSVSGAESGSESGVVHGGDACGPPAAVGVVGGRACAAVGVVGGTASVIRCGECASPRKKLFRL